jgi:hypothetical protein
VCAKERQHIHPQGGFSGETNMKAMVTIFGYDMEAKDIKTKLWLQGKSNSIGRLSQKNSL